MIWAKYHTCLKVLVWPWPLTSLKSDHPGPVCAIKSKQSGHRLKMGGWGTKKCWDQSDNRTEWNTNCQFSKQRLSSFCLAESNISIITGGRMVGLSLLEISKPKLSQIFSWWFFFCVTSMLMWFSTLPYNTQNDYKKIIKGKQDQTRQQLKNDKEMAYRLNEVSQD